jgi:nucleotide-binding universal stress UspA family protein
VIVALACRSSAWRESRSLTAPNADLIIVGTRGLNTAQRLLLGSVSTKVMHHAPCDVLVVR